MSPVPQVCGAALESGSGQRLKVNNKRHEISFYSGVMIQTVRTGTMADKDKKFKNEQTPLQQSAQNSKDAQVYLTWQTLIHILLKKRTKTHSWEQTRPLLFFFTRTKFREHFSTAPHVDRNGSAHVFTAQIKEAVCYCTKPDPKQRLPEKRVQFNSLFIILCNPLLFSHNIKQSDW